VSKQGHVRWPPVALGALLGMLAAAVTASPALAGRGPKWSIGPPTPFTFDASFCGFPVLVTSRWTCARR
jgi:hypothetical protein